MAVRLASSGKAVSKGSVLRQVLGESRGDAGSRRRTGIRSTSDSAKHEGRLLEFYEAGGRASSGSSLLPETKRSEPSAELADHTEPLERCAVDEHAPW